MSVVAIKKNENGFDIAADSICLAHDVDLSVISDKDCTKIKKINGTTIASCGSYEQIGMLFLFAKTHLLKSADEEAVIDYMSEFFDWRKDKTGKYDINKNSFLFLKDNKAFYFYNYECKEIHNYYAIGYGRDFALTALHLGVDVEKAIEVSCFFSVYCSLPVVKIL